MCIYDINKALILDGCFLFIRFLVCLILIGVGFLSISQAHDQALPRVIPWISGADVSQLPQLEAAGAQFYDHGEPEDALVLLRRYGLNTIRIKVWNDPGRYTQYPSNQSDLVGYNDTEHAVALAKRASKLGFHILIDLHYSDWWADPRKQTIPVAWTGKSVDEVNHAVSEFTQHVMQRLQQEHVTPDWVQVGNEISNGMLWPLGSTAHWDNLALFLKSGITAVHAVFPHTQTILHLDSGGNNVRCRTWFRMAQKYRIPFDIIGLSYYPVWHGSLQDLSANMQDLSVRFQRPVLVVETAYPWTTLNGDQQPNIYTRTGPESWPMTPHGQMDFLRHLIKTVHQVPHYRGLGIVYWEPEFIPRDGAGWKKDAGDEWDNVTLFDFQGHVLPGLRVMNAEDVVNE